MMKKQKGFITLLEFIFMVLVLSSVILGLGVHSEKQQPEEGGDDLEIHSLEEPDEPKLISHE